MPLEDPRLRRLVICRRAVAERSRRLFGVDGAGGGIREISRAIGGLPPPIDYEREAKRRIGTHERGKSYSKEGPV